MQTPNAFYRTDVLKFFGCELGAQTKYDKTSGTCIVNGALSPLASCMSHALVRDVYQCVKDLHCMTSALQIPSCRIVRPIETPNSVETRGCAQKWAS